VTYNTDLRGTGRVENAGDWKEDGNVNVNVNMELRISNQESVER